MSTVAPSFILVAGDGTTIRFPRKRYFLFQPPTQSECGFKESGSWKFKKNLKSRHPQEGIEIHWAHQSSG
jgi:hypothetical protein